MKRRIVSAALVGGFVLSLGLIWALHDRGTDSALVSADGNGTNLDKPTASEPDRPGGLDGTALPDSEETADSFVPEKPSALPSTSVLGPLQNRLANAQLVDEVLQVDDIGQTRRLRISRTDGRPAPSDGGTT